MGWAIGRVRNALDLSLYGSLRSTETNGNDQTMRIFRIPIDKKTYKIDIKD